MGQAADFDPGAGLGRQQPEFRELAAARLGEIFGNDGRARNRRRALFHQHRRGAGGIEHQEVLAPLPGALLDEPRGLPKLLQDEPDKTRVRTEWMMKQGQHARIRHQVSGIRHQEPALPLRLDI
jgi:hypothetical protein